MQYLLRGIGHQTLVIARVGQMNLHRVLAAVHHQDLSGHAAVQRCLQLVRIFSAPAQRLPVQTELDFAAALPDNDEAKDEVSTDAESRALAPFPFTLNCLIIGTAHNPTGTSNHGVREMSTEVAIEDLGKDDTVTVVDISDLSHVRYGFFNLGARYLNDEPSHTHEIALLTETEGQPVLHSSVYSPLTAR